MTARPDIVEVSTAAMGTVVTIQAHGAPSALLHARLRDALALAHDVERTCSRFAADSELVRLCATHGTPVMVSPLLYGVLEIALAVAEASAGAFDPTLGAALHARGFATHWRTGAPAPRPAATMAEDEAPQAWRDVLLLDAHQVLLHRPLLLDLGGVAKGFALDLMAAALADLPGAMLDAGGDLRVLGTHPDGRAWRIAVRDPHDPARAITALEVADGAVCTSGIAERRDALGRPHIVDARARDDDAGTDPTVPTLRSVTVCAPLAAIADALATAAFVLGVDAGGALLTTQGTTGVFVVHDGSLVTTDPAPVLCPLTPLPAV
ncbi:MAG: FAD:protein FMN transferase [Gemmatimonadetes bacterium]|nr:FAD:protein FMN transferase [Gemmatimonadota bacterium]